jgi:hypothetical protein
MSGKDLNGADGRLVEGAAVALSGKTDGRGDGVPDLEPPGSCNGDGSMPWPITAR